MSEAELSCVQCGFSVPYDEVGVALMKAHLEEGEHEGDSWRWSEEPTP